MESLKTRYEALKKCLATLEDVLQIVDDPKFNIVYDKLRDSVIQRFEFTIDTFWKFLREYIEQVHGASLTTISPKEVLRIALQEGILEKREFDICIAMVKDRNLTSHTYNEILAESIKDHIENYYQLIKKIFERISLPQ